MNRCRRFGDQTPVALLMAGPAMTGLILFILAPFLTALMLAFTNLRLGSPLRPRWAHYNAWGASPCSRFAVRQSAE